MEVPTGSLVVVAVLRTAATYQRQKDNFSKVIVTGGFLSGDCVWLHLDGPYITLLGQEEDANGVIKDTELLCYSRNILRDKFH